VSDSGGVRARSNWLILHGATSNRALRALRSRGQRRLHRVTHDSLVMALRLPSSVNYRSVILYGQAEGVSDADEDALGGGADRARRRGPLERRATAHREVLRTLVLRVPIREGSARSATWA
jgi:nitroimidazol reductase NimA-like FMN-containing flavoprotein (pyridoxamine 5'-phosphate oxidase superfamily)